ncbi:uncharacterized protein L3040_006017 [Drepanopeziza brunnea f. sp. 'multigermtubi']|uniref:Uncharacterized protein n=1 Tax=Marssonina brunnea f. sp. multigermtubi (strain MB_m1) TaxID=1072389 RepID=K1WE35_MARBU|nr:uncharacterized protein MBM_06263 [Drepanopeziza brunnea f. sp. 'multigermtubi' MB_m1]EKD15635.1 hypothetical protein MBM_06263 [Drepanopeziza brunnea f. sp. 'multigermtubi' MB_m1]KAJ5040361.1 hypothetical protein L3040_006017 [Drepanopeziza brunnea f. sp. 'multigermtubi']
MILPRVPSPFHTRPPSSQAPPQSPPPAPSPPPQWVLPKSYRVALCLDASILLLTFVILIGAVLYLRRRGPIPNYRRIEEEETLLFSHVDDAKDPMMTTDMDEREDTAMDEKVEKEEAAAAAVAQEEGRKKKQKRGHLRLEAPRIVIWDAETGSTMADEEEVEREEAEREEAGRWTTCTCRGRIHPACWWFELEYKVPEDGRGGR